MERILRLRSGVELLVAMNGTDGLSTAASKAERIRLVLLDHRLPDMTGGDVLLALKADTVTAALPVTMISSDAAAAQVAAMLELGAQEYLTKPFDIDDFLGLIDRYCS